MDIHIGSLGQRRLCIGGCGVFGLGHELCLLAWLVCSRRSLLGLLPVSRANGGFRLDHSGFAITVVECHGRGVSILRRL